MPISTGCQKGTGMTQSSIATAADYAEAMLTARRAKTILALIVGLMLLAQLGIFLLMHYSVNPSDARIHWCRYVVGIIDFLGLAAPLVLAVNLLLIVGIMLVGRLIGVSHLVSAFLWCIALIVLLFPWQTFYFEPTFNPTDFKIPGVLYTWSELLARARPAPGAVNAPPPLLFWARFVGWPVAAILILLIIQAKSRRGMRLALGELAPKSIQPTA